MMMNSNSLVRLISRLSIHIYKWYSRCFSFRFSYLWPSLALSRVIAFDVAGWSLLQRAHSRLNEISVQFGSLRGDVRWVLSVRSLLCHLIGSYRYTFRIEYTYEEGEGSNT